MFTDKLNLFDYLLPYKRLFPILKPVKKKQVLTKPINDLPKCNLYEIMELLGGTAGMASVIKYYERIDSVAVMLSPIA